jgi:hypothetical protein
MSIFRIGVAILALVAWQAPTTESVLTKYVAALGGETPARALSSRVSKGKIAIETIGLIGTIEIDQKAPDRVLRIITLPGVPVSRQGFDGTTPWDEQDGQVTELSAFARREAGFYFPISMREAYPNLALQPDRAGSTDWIVRAPRSTSPKNWHFDKQSGLLTHTETYDGSGKLLISEDLTDYRAVDGLKLPFAIHRAELGGLKTSVVLTEIRHNVALDDKIFAKPTK